MSEPTAARALSAQAARVAGTLADCTQSGGKWTGAQCCLDGAVTCAEGTQADCKQSDGVWTGASCCLK